ncbi:hypothetical protein NIES22_73320 (plasmid) [Calothrix brevissima NIES-22]|nr:hypothetical protein NIES22_73320 [Calothrix brevissima NIES-22]
MNIDHQDLLNDETLLLSKAANAVIKINTHELKHLPYDQLMSLVDFKNKEAIGGMLYLTNYRLLFKSHTFNRVTGKFSIFLPTVQSVRDTSQLLTKKIEVATQTQTLEFVVWGIPSLIQAIKSAADALTEQQKANIKKCMMTDYAKIGDGLNSSKIMNKIALNMIDVINPLIEIIQDPINLSSVLNLLELWEILGKEEDKYH